MIKDIRIEYKGKFGDDIRETILNMMDYSAKVALATDCDDIIVHTVFNGISVEVDKNTILNDAVEKYHKDFYVECYKEYVKEDKHERLSNAYNEYDEIIDAIKTVDWIISCDDNPIRFMENVLHCTKRGYLNKKHCLKYISVSALLGKMEAMHEKHPELIAIVYDPFINKHRFMYQNVYRTLKEHWRCPEEVVKNYEI